MRGLFFASTLPLWEGFDEHAHFALVDSLARNKTWPSSSAPLSAEIQESLRILPLFKLLAGSNYMSHEEYWRKSDEQRRHLQVEFARLSPHSVSEQGYAMNSTPVN